MSLSASGLSLFLFVSKSLSRHFLIMLPLSPHGQPTEPEVLLYKPNIFRLRSLVGRIPATNFVTQSGWARQLFSLDQTAPWPVLTSSMWLKDLWRDLSRKRKIIGKNTVFLFHYFLVFSFIFSFFLHKSLQKSGMQIQSNEIVGFKIMVFLQT